MAYTNATGRRKTSVARIYMEQGSGKITINGKEIENYFPTAQRRYVVEQPFAITNLTGKYDLKVNVHGGGLTGQAEAIRMAISRALVKEDETLKEALKEEGLMTRDPRMVERKKPGHKKARKSFQFSKR